MFGLIVLRFILYYQYWIVLKLISFGRCHVQEWFLLERISLKNINVEKRTKPNLNVFYFDMPWLFKKKCLFPQKLFRFIIIFMYIISVWKLFNPFLGFFFVQLFSDFVLLTDDITTTTKISFSRPTGGRADLIQSEKIYISLPSV